MLNVHIQCTHFRATPDDDAEMGVTLAATESIVYCRERGGIPAVHLPVDGHETSEDEDDDDGINNSKELVE